MRPDDRDRILVIDDREDIHADFDKIFARRQQDLAALDALERQVLGQSSAADPHPTFELAHAYQGEEGVRLLQQARDAGRPFFVAFVDMRMPPGWDGLRTIREIRKIDADVAIVICTAYSDHSWDQIAAAVPSLDKLLVLKKPFDAVEVQALARCLRERWGLLQQSRLRHEELERLVTLRTAELRQHTMSDRLTGLPNRVQFTDQLAAAIDHHHRDPDSSYAVMFIDFDRFKVINDSLGHACGDRLLQAISERLRRAVAAADPGSHALVARMGGDEFCVLIRPSHDESRLAAAAQRLLDVFAEPHDIDGRRLTCTASIGITLSRIGYRNAEDAMRDADTAMYAAKVRGRGCAVLFDKSMHERAMQRLVLDNDLRQAVEQRQMNVWYQPIVSLTANAPIGAEALLRWRHPTLGMIAPNDFIPLAEETGLIQPLGTWVFEQVCLHLKEFPQLQYMSFNISPRQIAAPDFFAPFEEVLSRVDADTSRLVGEITENALTYDPVLAERAIDAMRARGIRVFLDDFGTGNSSLGSLRRFALDGIKLDRSFLDEHVFTHRTAAVIHSVVNMARNLDIAFVVEGVESLEQVAMLQELNCEAVQGYLFAHPVPAHELPATLLRTHPILGRAA